jgi:hypothetical protein
VRPLSAAWKWEGGSISGQIFRWKKLYSKPWAKRARIVLGMGMHYNPPLPKNKE